MWEHIWSGYIITVLLLAFTAHPVISEGHHKRVPSGFTGVRGKKSTENVVENNLPIYSDSSDFYLNEKRAPSYGFVGMRGKKPWNDYNFVDDSSPKRSPNQGFFGMRGKKVSSYYPDPSMLDNYKRGPSSGFFGMRGKKFTDFPLRGKKMPFEFRGKFVGVRGKKASPYAITSDNDALDDSNFIKKIGQDLDMNQLMLLLTENTTWEPQENDSSNTILYK